MNDPARLLDQGATTAELALLRAGANEEPSGEAVQQLAAVLGLASGAALARAVTKSAGTASVARGVASKLAAKWVVLGALGVASGFAIVASRGGATSHGVVARAPVPHTEEPTHEAAVVAPADTAGPSLPNTAADVPSPSEPAPKAVHHQSATAAQSPSIAKEIAALDVARRALAGGDAQGALHALSDYEASGTARMLRQEATLLRIEALVRAGDVSAARRVATWFLREHPNSPHERRNRALVGETP